MFVRFIKDQYDLILMYVGGIQCSFPKEMCNLQNLSNVDNHLNHLMGPIIVVFSLKIRN